jgi:two-component system, NtrC family, sensor kinase
MNDKQKHRILVIDDNPAIHEDFKKILGQKELNDLAEDDALMFGKKERAQLQLPEFEIHSAFQGREGLVMIEKGLQEGRPYTMAFVDIRMPPGWDGIETVTKIWQIDPCLQMVICTAYSDYSWTEMTARLGISDRVMILKKPFDNIEVIQLAHALAEKWCLRQKAEAKMEQLESMVAEHTRDLQTANERLKVEMTERQEAEKALRQAQKMEALGQLAGGIAHDFNNLLTVIRGYADCLQAEPIEPHERDKAINEIRFASDRAAKLTSQMLIFCRKKPLQRDNVDLNELIRHLGNLLRRLLGENIAVEFQSNKQLLMVHADAGMMEQIILNLAVNARDAMPNGGRLAIRADEIELRPENCAGNAKARPGWFACINVSDTGSGIAQEVLPHLFEPFFTTKGPGKGTGMGLATVYGIVQQHDGWIEVESKTGCGANFKIFLPKAADKTAAMIASKQKTEIAGGSEAILLVEDEEKIRQLAEKTLRDFGYRVYQAGSGAEALSVWAAHAHDIDLLFTDIMLPGGMSGCDLAKSLQTKNERLKIAFTTGYAVETFSLDGSLREGVNFLPKPYSAKSLASLVRHCLDEALKS